MAEQFRTAEESPAPLARDVIAPKTYRGAMESSFRELWTEAMLTEISNLRDHHVFSELPRSQVPRGARIVDTTWTFKSKSDQQGRLDRAKARIVARGFRQQAGIDHSGDVYSPVTSIVVWRAVVAEAARRHMRCLIVDIKSAYLMTPLTGAVYVTPPPGYSE